MLRPSTLERFWYRRNWIALFLLPLSWLYRLVIWVRRLAFASGIRTVERVSVPVLVVGNITVGGTGKTPLIIWLCHFLRDRGIKPGIISRGYGGSSVRRSQQVRVDSNPEMVGDEPVLLAQRTGCPVAVATIRADAGRELLEHHDCDLILCDDGLQHLGLHRDLEIAVVDGDRRFGNGMLLPAGPLREPVARLEQVDMIVSSARAGKNEFLMEYQAVCFVSLLDESVIRPLDAFSNKDVCAFAGIGNPARFFSMLRSADINIEKYEFPDHHHYSQEDFEVQGNRPVIMTEKDAVKCRFLNLRDAWFLKIDVKMSKAFEHRFNILIEELYDG